AQAFKRVSNPAHAAETRTGKEHRQVQAEEHCIRICVSGNGSRGDGRRGEACNRRLDSVELRAPSIHFVNHCGVSA
ncbi:hypothetical protein GGI11_006489, partial [Coemansia sp. RSA 2049]